MLWSGLIISFHTLPSSSIYSPDIITLFPLSYFCHISCTLLITRTSVLGWCSPVPMPSFLDSFRSCPSYLLLITRTSILGWCHHFVHVPLLLTYLKCCSLVACTLDLTFWVIQLLNILSSFWLFESSKCYVTVGTFTWCGLSRSPRHWVTRVRGSEYKGKVQRGLWQLLMTSG